MARKVSAIAPDWWDYTTLEADLIDETARLTARDLLRLSRPGFKVLIYDTLEDFYLAEALEYVDAWRQSTDDAPAGICGPIGPTEQLPLVARLVNSLDLDVRSGHFWGMDEWFDAATGEEVPVTHPLSFERADRELCFNRIRRALRMPDAHLHFPKADTTEYRRSWDNGVRCVVMQGGQGARTSGGGNISLVPTRAITVGPLETWKAEKVSIWHAGQHDNPFGQRLTALMISRRIVDTSVPMSLLADHPNVQFNYYRGGLGTCDVEMH
jgi:glucosamine-6-phosphate deaminase